MSKSNRPPTNICPLCGKRVVVNPRDAKKRGWDFMYKQMPDGTFCFHGYAHRACAASDDDDNEDFLVNL